MVYCEDCKAMREFRVFYVDGSVEPQWNLRSVQVEQLTKWESISAIADHGTNAGPQS